MQGQNNDDMRNTVLALVLSAGVLVVWSLVVQPRLLPAKPAAEATAQTNNTTPVPVAATEAPANNSTNASTAALPAAGSLSRAQAVALNPRVAIETPLLRGSLSLVGGRIDDVVLHTYRTTTEPNAPEVELLSPAQASNSYFAEFGYISNDKNVTLPQSQTVWQAQGNQKLTPTTPVILTWQNTQGLQVQRTISVDDKYMLTLQDTIKNSGSAPVVVTPYGRLQRDGDTAMNVSSEEAYATRGGIGWNGQSLQEFTFDKLIKNPLQELELSQGWISFADKYWLTALLPETKSKVRYQYLTIEGQKVFQTDYSSDALSVPAGGSAQTTHKMFVGAKDTNILRHYTNTHYISHFDYAVDWGYFWFFTRPVFDLLLWLKHLTGHIGFALLILTLIVKTVFYPLTKKSFVMGQKMRDLQPKLKELREKHAQDPMALQKNMLELYRREKINPFAGFWPVLLQIPVFFALYKVLSITLEMRHAPFWGWISDLSSHDPTNVFTLFGLLKFSLIPFVSIGAWPILMGVTMYLQQKLSSTGLDPQQEKILKYLPIIVTFFLANFSVGLIIYWTWSNIISTVQMLWMRSRMVNPKVVVLK